MSSHPKPLSVKKPPPDSLEHDAEMLADSILEALNLTDELIDPQPLETTTDTCVIRIGPRFNDISDETYSAQRLDALRRRLDQGEYHLDPKAIASALLSKVHLFA